MFIDLDPQKVDVNVHPSKLEVKFDDEKNIYNFVLAVAKKSLGHYDLIPNIEFSEDQNSPVLKNKYSNPSEKNDFSSWVRDCLGDRFLAKRMTNAQSIEDLQKEIFISLFR